MITIIICTYNRVDNLKQTLSSLGVMSVPSDISWELIVVDNNSTDATAEVVEDFTRTSGLNVSYLFERNQGLSYARNAGIKHAKGDIISFTDDDCIVDTQWLVSILREFEANPLIGLVGGRVELFNPADRPITTAVSSVREELTSLKQLFTSLIHGCNMSFKKTVFQDVGEFDTDLGAGTKIASAEDSDMIYRTYKSGARIIYSPDALIYHNHGRRTDFEVESLMQGYARGRGGFFAKHLLRGDRDAMRGFCGQIKYRLVTYCRKMLCGGDARRERLMLAHLLLGAGYKLRSMIPRV